MTWARVLERKIKEDMGNYLRCFWRHEARRREALAAALQLLGRNHREVLWSFFQSVSQKVVCGDFVPEDWVVRQSPFQIIRNANQVL
jgi:hypothetical protein